MIGNSIYRFRVSILDLPLSNFTLHIFVQHNQPPRYLDLLYKIEQHSQISLESLRNLYLISIEKSEDCKYPFKDDMSLQHVFEYISDRDNNLEIKLIKKGSADRHSSISRSDASIIRPIFIRRPSLIDAEEELIYRSSRKDSGISLEEDIGQFEKQRLDSLPILSPIITTPSSPNNDDRYYLPSPPPTRKSPINLPRLSSIISNYKQKQLAPIYPYHRTSLFDEKSVSLPSQSNRKLVRRNTTQPTQFICEQIIDNNTGKLCFQSFRRSYDLSRHQTIHLKNRPLCYCQDCGKKFTRLDALRRHERIQGHNNK